MSLPVTLKLSGMEGKTTRTEVSGQVAPRLTDSCVSKNGCCSTRRSPHQECLDQQRMGRMEVGKDASSPEPDGCLESCSDHRRKNVGIGVWLCFICCPLQGGSNLQPAHEPVNPKNLSSFFFYLNPKKLFLSRPPDWAGRLHYQLDSYQMTSRGFFTDRGSPSVSEAFWDFNQALSSPTSGLKTLAGKVFEPAGAKRRPAQTSETSRAGGRGGFDGWITP